MVDNQPELIEDTMRKAERTADEKILSAMVKTAIRSNVGEEKADQTASLSDVLEERAKRDNREE
jgi:hypothetical protein